MCGIIGVLNQNRPAAAALLAGLQGQQHRGQESAGIVLCDNGALGKPLREMGLVSEAFFGKNIWEARGSVGIGHVRYSTVGKSSLQNTQPIIDSFRGRAFGLVHNGSLVNLRELAAKTGWNNAAGSDSHLIAHLISTSPAGSMEEAILDTVPQLKGAFNLIVLFDEKLYTVKDRFGFHPLQIGIREGNGDWIVASESCVFDAIGAALVADIEPGSLYIVDKLSCRKTQWADADLKIDIFEYVYFAAPPSVIYGVEAGNARYWMGRLLGKRYAYQHPVPPNTVIIPIPDSGNTAAQGFYDELCKQNCTVRFSPWALHRPHSAYGRTFIEPTQTAREAKLARKFNPRPMELAGEYVIAVDDSIVRGTTIPFVASLICNAGAKAVHAAIASPPILYPCFYGTDTGRDTTLIAAAHNGNTHAIAEALGLDSVTYLPIEYVREAILCARAERLRKNLPKPEWRSSVHLSPETFYEGHFTGQYPDGLGDFSSILN